MNERQTKKIEEKVSNERKEFVEYVRKELIDNEFDMMTLDKKMKSLGYYTIAGDVQEFEEFIEWIETGAITLHYNPLEENSRPQIIIKIEIIFRCEDLREGLNFKIISVEEF